jgi:uncharacterized protein YndB with AHSA1/START domain
MTANLFFNFLVDQEKNTITVRREFAADRQLVWDCHTKSELLEQWFAPKPWKARTKSMDFREGGHWHYAMCGPDGEEHWGRMDYFSILPIESYKGWDGFCGAEGEMNAELPRAEWHSTFEELSDKTLVQTVITYQSLTDLETVIQMGMKEGFTMALDQLEVLFDELKK